MNEAARVAHLSSGLLVALALTVGGTGKWEMTLAIARFPSASNGHPSVGAVLNGLIIPAEDRSHPLRVYLTHLFLSSAGTRWPMSFTFMMVVTI
jgi:hypothetical protein